jgi:hypothetical protein
MRDRRRREDARRETTEQCHANCAERGEDPARSVEGQRTLSMFVLRASSDQPNAMWVAVIAARATRVAALFCSRVRPLL